MALKRKTAGGKARTIPVGIAFGLLSYVVISLFTGKAKEIKGATWVITLLFLLTYHSGNLRTKIRIIYKIILILPHCKREFSFTFLYSSCYL